MATDQRTSVRDEIEAFRANPTGPPGPVTFAIETITPEQAAEHVAGMRVRESAVVDENVEALTEMILNGEWHWSRLPPLMFDGDGVNQDGRHRLMAIARAGRDVRIGVRRSTGSGLLSFPENYTLLAGITLAQRHADTTDHE